MNKASRTDKMSRGKATHWKSFGDQALSELIVDEKRAAWILRTYPPEETGRPGMLYTPQPGETLRQRIPKRDVEEPVEIDSLPSWRRTTEFFGAEEELEKEEVAVAVAEEELVEAA